MSIPAELKRCPFCGSAPEARNNPAKRTLEEALSSTPIVNCSKVHCIARHVCATPKEWNMREASND